MSRRRDVRVLPLAIVAAVSIVAVGLTVVSVAPDVDPPPQMFSDFDINVWEPGRAILDGRSPLREYDADARNGSVYPPAAQVATLPFTLLPHAIGLVLWLATLAAALVLALRVCGVRDWRVMVVALCSPPVLYGLAYANVSLLVTLGVGLAWAWRDRKRRAGIVVGALVATRLFVWPLLVWLLVTGRRRAAFEGLLTSFVVTLVGWAAVEFRRIGDFPHVVRDNAQAWLDDGVSAASIVANLGLSASATTLVAGCAGIGALAVAWWRRDDDLESFAWTLVSALLASPVVWSHYYALLLVPLAVSTPRLSRWWLLPYLTIPQLSVAAEAGGRIVDAAAGVAFALMTAIRCRPSLRATRASHVAADLHPAEAS